MSEEKNLKRENGENPEGSEREDVEGYAFCSSKKNKCLNDCVVVDGPMISELN